MKHIFFLLSVLLALTLACGTATPTAQPGALETIVAATLTALPAPAQPTSPPLPTTAPPSPLPPTAPAPTSPPACQPPHPGAQSLPLPAGFAAGINTLAVEFFDFEGNSLGAIQTPGMSWLAPNQLHIGGRLSQGIANIPLVYDSPENGGIFKISQGGVSQYLAGVPDLVTLSGGAGTTTLAFSRFHNDPAAGGWASWLYAGEAVAIGSSQPLLSRSEGDGFVIYPLGVHMQGNTPRGVWYTLSLWGIGSIIFAPYNGLYYFDLATSQVTEFLPFSDRLAGLSPDGTMAAYLAGAGGQSAGIATSLDVRDLTTCQGTTIPLNPASNLGAGYVVFSPDNHYLAWLEAGGPSPMEAQMRLRVATTQGAMVIDAPISALSSLSGGAAATYISPLAWAANHLLLLEIGVEGQNAPLIVLWAPDPSQPLNPALGANQSAPLTSGVFGGMLYP